MMASEKTTFKTLVQAMAEFAFALRYDAIPREVIAGRATLFSRHFDVDLLEKMTWLMHTETTAPGPQQLLELCGRLVTVEDLAKLVECCRANESTMTR